MNNIKLKFSIQNLFKFTLRNFSKKYEGIKGDVNWSGETFLDGRPRISRYIHDLPNKNFDFKDFISTDIQRVLNELENPARITYSRKKRSAGKIHDLILDDKK
jgi:hypothetical protein